MTFPSRREVLPTIALNHMYTIGKSVEILHQTWESAPTTSHRSYLPRTFAASASKELEIDATEPCNREVCLSFSLIRELGLGYAELWILPDADGSIYLYAGSAV